MCHTGTCWKSSWKLCPVEVYLWWLWFCVDMVHHMVAPFALDLVKEGELETVGAAVTVSNLPNFFSSCRRSCQNKKKKAKHSAINSWVHCWRSSWRWLGVTDATLACCHGNADAPSTVWVRPARVSDEMWVRAADQNPVESWEITRLSPLRDHL